jgi:hypothetical protein
MIILLYFPLALAVRRGLFTVWYLVRSGLLYVHPVFVVDKAHCDRYFCRFYVIHTVHVFIIITPANLCTE